MAEKLGESLGGSQAPQSFWKAPGLPRKLPGDFPGSSFTVEFKSNPELLQKFHGLPQSERFPGDHPGGRPLSL